MADGEQKTKSEDVLLVHSPTEDGRGYRVLRKRDERLEVGALHPVEEGQPLRGELLKLTPRDGTPLYDVDVQYAPPRASPAHASGARASHGPPQVASDAYRTQWDAIFGARDERQLPASQLPASQLPASQRPN